MNILYGLALEEKEGLGTAYEYYVKLKLLKRVLGKIKIKSVLIYGLPEKYGYSLDFFFFCKKNNIQCYVYDKRDEKIRELIDILKQLEVFEGFTINVVNKIDKVYDLVLSCEAMQYLNEKGIKLYINNIKRYSRKTIIFVPNKDNKNHGTLSGLKSFRLEELDSLFPKKTESGYIDMPPFKPGVKMKKKMKNNYLVNLLVLFAYLERLIPKSIKKGKAHICYILL